MDAQFARPADKPPLRRPPLITPSASPPVSRIRNRPPAAKRPRLSATPSASSSAQRSSSVANDLDAERTRLESLDRLFKTWDQLAERYHKPLDEDDIVDLRDLAILKDRGVTRGTAGTYAIGSMIVPTDEASSQAGDDDNTGEEEEEESADELDLISDPPGPSVPEEYKKWYVPPADQTNPEDAEMFREFEEAEKKMRELYGLDGDEATAEPEQDGGSEPPLEGEEEEMDEQMVYSPAGPKFTPQRRRSRPPPKTPGDDLSEDEFAAWDFDETPVPQRRSAPLPQPAADDDDIIDLTGSPEPSPPKPKPTPQQRGRSRPGPQPENRARSHTRSNSKPPNPAPAEKRDRTPEIGQSSADEQLVLQLLTPPRSSSAPESITSIPDHESAPSPLPPAETPSPKFPKPRARYTPRPRTPSDDEDDDLPPPPPPLNLPFKVGPPRGVKKQTAKKQTSVKGKELKVEVFISVPPKKLNGKAKSARPPSPEPPSTPSPPPSKSNKGKGKEKAVPEPPSNTDIAPTTLRRRRSQSQPRLPTRVSDSPQPLPPPRGTKRRRVSSLSSLSDSSPARPVTPDPISVPRNAARTNRLTRSGSSKSGYSSDIPPPTSSPVHSDADDDDEGSGRAGRSRPRPASVAPHMPPYPYPPPMFPPYTRYGNSSSASARGHQPEERHTTPLPASGLQDPQAQLMFAHAWHSLSYLMASGAIPAPPPPGAGYPPGIPFPHAPWPPYTPSHQRHRTHPFDTPSSASEAGPSRTSTYFTPTHHPHPYPYAYDPMFSDGTLPPSSPIPSSPATSSPALRPASVPPGQRSRSRGRRVSFKLDEHDRPLPLTPGRPHDPSDDHRTEPSSSSKGKGKGKGKARAEPEPEPERREEEESSDDEPPPRPPRGRALQRASTPAPPSQRVQSVPAGSSSTSASSKANKTPKSAKRKH
ncbi:hypothetical protein L226DRAFT_611016 [Lentinus tigrinus ALCF2SS1-7]|uniref:uncharacterized protein n=1 Tax=Lentinus tigrinus ALCF2SS1-7 TaxID=1328758 RepID=UPI001165FBBD|nr:hypothetical protein L226DRAFT_611016 [Lentinus tigrinus ALCF2SS1-7]